MPKSKRNRVVHMTQVSKKTREQKDKLFTNIRETVPEYQHVLVFSIDNMRNNHIKVVRHELSDCRVFFGKTKLMAKALGQSPETALLDNLDRLSPFITGTVGLLLTNREPASVLSYLQGLSQADFARAGAVAPRAFIVPPGVVHATGGEVPRAYDVPMEHSVEPELRKLGIPTRMVRGRIVLGADEKAGEGIDESDDALWEQQGGYVVCREGQVLDSRQTRLLKLFGVCLAQFKVKVTAYWSASNGEVSVLDETAMDGVDADEGSD